MYWLRHVHTFSIQMMLVPASLYELNQKLVNIMKGTASHPTGLEKVLMMKKACAKTVKNFPQVPHDKKEFLQACWEKFQWPQLEWGVVFSKVFYLETFRVSKHLQLHFEKKNHLVSTSWGLNFFMQVSRLRCSMCLCLCFLFASFYHPLFSFLMPH